MPREGEDPALSDRVRDADLDAEAQRDEPKTAEPTELDAVLVEAEDGEGWVSA